jgi:hypothetical protein
MKEGDPLSEASCGLWGIFLTARSAQASFKGHMARAYCWNELLPTSCADHHRRTPIHRRNRKKEKINGWISD